MDTVAGPQPGYVYLSYHRADTGDQRGEGGDGAAGRIRDWLTSKGYVVLMGERDDDADGGKKVRRRVSEARPSSTARARTCGCSG